MKRINSFLFLRLMTSLLFYYAGLKHLVSYEKILGRLSTTRLYNLFNLKEFFLISIWITGILMITGAVLLTTTKFYTKAAGLLLLVLIPVTISVQLENPNDLGPFFKNVAIAGSLLFILKNKENEILKDLHVSNLADQ